MQRRGTVVWLGVLLWVGRATSAQAADTQAALLAARELLQEARRAAMTLPDLDKSPVLAQIRRAAARVGDQQGALEAHWPGPVTDPDNLGRIAGDLASAGNSAGAWEVANSIPPNPASRLDHLLGVGWRENEERDVAIYRIAVSTARRGDIPGALASVDRRAARTDALKAGALARIATIQAASGDRAGFADTIRKARAIAGGSLFDSFRDERGRIDKANARLAVAKAYHETGDQVEARHLLNEARVSASAMDANHDGQPCLLACIAEGLAASGDLPGAVQTLDQAEKTYHGDRCTEKAEQPIILALVRSGDREAALARVDRLGIIERFNMVADIARLEARSGHRESALLLLTQYREKAVTTLTGSWRSYLPQVLRTLAEAYVQIGELPEALATIELLPADRNISPVREKMQVYIQARDFPGALAVAATLPEARDGPKWKAILMIVKGQCDAGVLPGALTTAQSIPSQYGYSNTEARRILARAQAKAGNRADALETLARVREKPDADILRILCTKAAQAGDLQWAMEMAGQQTKPAARAHAFLGAAEGLIPWKDAEPIELPYFRW